MLELPISVQVSLWVSAAYAGALPVDEALRRACPDTDLVNGRTERFHTWADLGQHVVLVALPRPGIPGLLPRGSAVLAAATEAGQCVFVPGLGDVLVPTVSTSPSGSSAVTHIRWAAYAGDPLPGRHLDHLDPDVIEAHLADEIGSVLARSWPVDIDLPGMLTPRTRDMIVLAAQVGSPLLLAQATCLAALQLAGIRDATLE
ncbi:hypothetical protein KEM60_00522 [Austwickia sp. TVS 96-490-7B]|uniref:hypothetical protein n=1 Tax=Austwickia sp. TVS 96-490-7B TaxID=2830843 RepID=UPI001C5623F4|nr:hypothetical protein [Austwickia sp. TVS 96-490-7B]MBW3084335.1 hypothetical protein [Austwickia sp. TVS 96-490-7B]